MPYPKAYKIISDAFLRPSTKTIWKFELEVTDNQYVNMPYGAELLSVQTQGTTPCLWALVDAKNPTEERHFEVFGTGHPVNCDMGIERKYIGTFQLSGGATVFHLFERL